MLANQRPAFCIFSDITNLRFRQNYVLNCEAFSRIFVEIWFEIFHPSAVSELALYSTGMLI